MLHYSLFPPQNYIRMAAVPLQLKNKKKQSASEFIKKSYKSVFYFCTIFSLFISQLSPSQQPELNRPVLNVLWPH